MQKHPLNSVIQLKRFYERLNEAYQNFALSYTTVQKYVKENKRRFINLHKSFLPLDHCAGSAQVDFFDCTFIENEKTISGYSLILSFPQSNAAFCQLFKGKASECLLQGLKNIFSYLGGTPHSIWFDNDASIIKILDKRKKEKKVNEHFLRFKNHYSFIAKFCNMRSPHEKGNVESNVQLLRNKFFVPVPSIENLDEYNKNLLQRCDILLNREHYFRKRSIKELFAVDKNAFLDLPEIEFDTATKTKRKVNNIGKITVDNIHHYYLNPTCAKRQVLVRQSYKEIIIHDPLTYKEVVRLPRLFGSSIQSEIDWGQYLPVIIHKPNCIQNIGLTKLFSSKLQEHVFSLDKESLKQFLKELYARYAISKDLGKEIEFFEEKLISQ